MLGLRQASSRRPDPHNAGNLPFAGQQRRCSARPMPGRFYDTDGCQRRSNSRRSSAARPPHGSFRRRRRSARLSRRGKRSVCRSRCCRRGATRPGRAATALDVARRRRSWRGLPTRPRLPCARLRRRRTIYGVPIAIPTRPATHWTSNLSDPATTFAWRRGPCGRKGRRCGAPCPAGKSGLPAGPRRTIGRAPSPQPPRSAEAWSGRLRRGMPPKYRAYLYTYWVALPLVPATGSTYRNRNGISTNPATCDFAKPDIWSSRWLFLSCARTCVSNAGVSRLLLYSALATLRVGQANICRQI